FAEGVRCGRPAHPRRYRRHHRPGMGAVSSTTRTLLPTQTGVLRALANEVALRFELDRFRAERIGDPQRRDEDRITRLLAQVVDLRATDEDPRGDGRDTAPPQALSRGYRADSGEPSRTDPSRAKSARGPEVKPGENLGPAGRPRARRRDESSPPV